jgi:hypothetical protein
MGLLRMILRKYGREPKIENFGASNEIHAWFLLFCLYCVRYSICKLYTGYASNIQNNSRRSIFICPDRQQAAQVKRKTEWNVTKITIEFVNK